MKIENKKELIKRIVWKIVQWGLIIIIILWAVGYSFMLATWDNEIRKCADEFGGKVVRGYCTYVENGTSESYSIWNKGDS